MAGIAELFKPKPAAPTIIAPQPRDPAPLPVENDAARNEARLRRRRNLSARQGRASTVLSDRREFGNERLGQ